MIKEICDGISGLLRNGSATIYISFAAEDTSENHSKFQTLCASEKVEYEELKAFCFLKELDYIQDFLKPIDDACNEPYSHSTNELQNFLESMLIANRAKAHIVDQKKYGPLGALRNIEDLRGKISDKSIWNTLDRLEGLIREYSDNTIFRLHGNNNITVCDFKKIKNTSDYQELSECYYTLGNTTSSPAVITALNKHVRKIAMADATGPMIKLATIGISVVASTVAPLASLVEFLYDYVKVRDNVDFVPIFIPSEVIGWQQYNTNGLDNYVKENH